MHIFQIQPAQNSLKKSTLGFTNNDEHESPMIGQLIYGQLSLAAIYRRTEHPEILFSNRRHIRYSKKTSADCFSVQDEGQRASLTSPLLLQAQFVGYNSEIWGNIYYVCIVEGENNPSIPLSRYFVMQHFSENLLQLS